MSQYSFTIDGLTTPPPPVTQPDHEAMLRYFLNRPVVFPPAEKPVVSIIIPVFNQFEYTMACLHSLANACAGNVPYEVILADDGSTDRTREISPDVANLRIIRNESDRHGFLPNANFASQSARGDYLFFLNNDTLLLENGGLLDHLTDCFADPTVGMVGNRIMNAKGEVKHSTWLFSSDRSFYDLNSANQTTLEGDAVEGSALMLRRELWRELGGFDPAYGRGYFEESDLAFRIKTQKHLRVICDMRSQIIHFGQRTFRKSAANDAAFMKNSEFFFQRWHDYLTEREQGLPDGNREARAMALYNKLYRNRFL